jgi:hypothetical protein
MQLFTADNTKRPGLVCILIIYTFQLPENVTHNCLIVNANTIFSITRELCNQQYADPPTQFFSSSCTIFAFLNHSSTAPFPSSVVSEQLADCHSSGSIYLSATRTPLSRRSFFFRHVDFYGRATTQISAEFRL